MALCELQRDTVGFDYLASPHRQFLRQGCLNKFSTRKGYLQRMFFLVGFVLLNRQTSHYKSKLVPSSLNSVIQREFNFYPQYVVSVIISHKSFICTFKIWIHYLQLYQTGALLNIWFTSILH